MATVEVTALITHTYTEDLHIELRRDGVAIKELRTCTGGAGDGSLRLSTTVDLAPRSDSAGTWSLAVGDYWAADSGEIHRVLDHLPIEPAPSVQLAPALSGRQLRAEGQARYRQTTVGSAAGLAPSVMAAVLSMDESVTANAVSCCSTGRVRVGAVVRRSVPQPPPRNPSAPNVHTET